MRLKFIGIDKKTVEVNKEFGKIMLETGYFKEVKEIIIKKSKKKGDD